MIHAPSRPAIPAIAARASGSSTACRRSRIVPMSIAAWLATSCCVGGPPLAAGNGPSRNCASASWSAAPYPGADVAPARDRIRVDHAAVEVLRDRALELELAAAERAQAPAPGRIDIERVALELLRWLARAAGHVHELGDLDQAIHVLVDPLVCVFC